MISFEWLVYEGTICSSKEGETNSVGLAQNYKLWKAFIFTWNIRLSENDLVFF